MTKKIFAFVIALVLMFFTSSVFATVEIKDSMNKAGNTMQNVVNGAGTVIQNGASAISTGVKDVGNAVGNGTTRVGSGMTKTATGTTNNGYTATRTGATGKIMGMSANTWTWFILAIAALAIVALVWYYAMQDKTEYNHHND